MRSRILAIATVAAVIALGCKLTTHHTIEAHITLDIRHIEQTASNVLDYVEGDTSELVIPEVSSDDSGCLPRRLLEMLSPVQRAYAAELKNTSPRITQIARSMRERHEQIAAMKTKNYIGENNRGYVQIINEPGNSDELNNLQQLVAAENKDRKALYEETARLNDDQNVNVSTVEHIYAAEHLSRAKTGQYVQLPSDGPFYERFKKTPLASKLAANAAPGKWLQVP